MKEAAGGELCGETPIPWASAPPCPLIVLLDNVRSAYNTGSIFRIAGGVGVASIHLCGITPTPAQSKVAKTALGAEAAVPWFYSPNAPRAAVDLREHGVALWALENAQGSTALLDDALPPNESGVCLIVGNEITGIDPGLLSMCERILHIPMEGSKGSLNVAVAFGIAAYWLRGAAHVTGEAASCA